MGIFFTEEGRIFGASALLLQALPGAEMGFVELVESTLASLPPLGLWFSERGTRATLLRQIFGDFGVRQNADAELDFDCPCSASRFLDHIASLDRETLSDIMENGPWPLETTCHYCASTYRFNREALAKALAAERL
jgi:molecular chaperone Hsp33